MAKPIIRNNPNPDGVFCLGGYTPMSVHNEEGTRPSGQDRHVMNMKANNLGKPRQEESVAALVPMIRSILVPPVVLIAIPPSKVSTPRSGLHLLCERLADSEGIVDGGGLLARTKDKEPAHLGGERDADASYESLSLKNPSLLRAKRVLILDDMSKTGSEIAGARRHVIQAGARQIEALAIGCTGGATSVK